MGEKRLFGITLIGYFYIFGAIVLLVTLFTNSADEFGIAVRVGLPNIPENIVKILLVVISLVIAYGYLKLEKWGYWFMTTYSIYFLIVSLILSLQYKQQPFYGNVIWSIIVLMYTLRKRKYFDSKAVAS
ncbi:MAG: hypothetical protein QJR05_03950 [Thermoanaerobacterium sp.]|nr:hypothetical protein [Thermoanaerobacterium sp.]